MNRIGSHFKSLTWFMALLLAAFAAGCGGGGGGVVSDTGPGQLNSPAPTTPGPGTGLGGVGQGPAPVNLGTAGNFAILTKTGISTTGGTLVTGDIGVSPEVATAITGFALVAPPTTSTTSAQVVGLVYASDYDPLTPANLTTSVANMETAFTDAAGRPAGVGPFLNLGAGTVAGRTLVAGVYTWGSNVNITTDLTLSGGANDVWIFQITGTLDLAAGKNIILSGGAVAKNVFWQVSDTVNLLAGSHFEGVILAQTDVAIRDGASVTGRLLAQAAVTLINNAITQPAP